MNTFGSASLQFSLTDHRAAISARSRFRREAIPSLSRVNTFYCPGGRYPFRGWVLLPRSEYVQLNAYSTDLRLTVGSAGASELQTLKGLSVVQAKCVTRGLASASDALYLVDLTDVRGILHNRWFSAPLTKQYNIRAPAYPQTFHPQSMNGGTTWTWATMLQDIWQTMSLLGAWPGVPSSVTLSGTPEGFWFTGVGAWVSLCAVLDHLGLTVAVNLQSSTPYTIVSTGADDSTFTTLQAKYLPNLEDDLEWRDLGSGRVPGTVVVLFKRRNSVYGTEETVRYDSPQWDMAAYYSVSVASPTTFSSAAGTHYIWDDFTVRYDQDGVPLSADTATASTIASERVSQYFDRIYSRTSGYLTQTYTGSLPFTTGAQVDGVCWYWSSGYGGWSGWRTQVVRGNPPWPELWDETDALGWQD